MTQVKDITAKKVIFLTSTARIANIYTKSVFGLKFWESRGEVLICRVATADIVYHTGRDIGNRTVDEYLYTKDIPPDDIIFESNPRYPTIIRQNPYLYHPKASKDKFKIAPSKPHGNGVICIAKISKGEDISWVLKRIDNTGTVTVDWELSNAARVINHSDTPNARIVMTEKNSKYTLVAKDTILPKTEITCDYHDCPEVVVRLKKK